MRRPLIGVSLKMYLDHEQTLAWARKAAAVAEGHPALLTGRVSLVVFPAYTDLHAVVDVVDGTPIEVGAQDLFWEDSGPYTGAVGGPSLTQIGCRWVEIGHAERRRLFGDTDRSVARRVTAAVRNRLTPLLCIGEEERGRPEDAVTACIRQLDAALAETVPDRLVVAYEPQWAIGADRPAPPDHVRAVATALRDRLDVRGLTDSRVIYGGTAGPGSLERLGAEVDGLFLGRRAHDVAGLRAVLDELIARPQAVA
ncbi:triose-phosphate isomerase [Microbacterium tumbae]